jgi:hypothetical protein
VKTGTGIAYIGRNPNLSNIAHGAKYYDRMTANREEHVVTAQSTVASLAGVDEDINSTYYIYRIGTTYYVSNVRRSVGWHSFEIRVTPDKTYFVIDDIVQPTTGSGLTVTRQELGSFWSANTEVAYFDCSYLRKFVDPEPSHGAWGSEETPAYYIYISDSAVGSDVSFRAYIEADSAVGFDVKVSLPLTQTYARLAEMESIVPTLRYVTLNDYVLHTDYNGVVEVCQTFLKLAEALVSELFMYDPEVRSKLEELRLAILKLCKVRVFDIVSSRDHNKVVEAIFKMREFIILVRQKLGLS